MLTVAICTWRRAELLRRALASHAAACVPESLEWELLVVDNDPAGGATARAVDEFAGRLPVRCIPEPTLGISHARNAAVREARGTYLLWTDDDVLVPPHWLAAYADAIARWPEAAVFGGPIRPFFDDPPPAWLRRALPVVGHAFSLFDLGAKPTSFSGARVPFGANYAIRAAEQRSHLYSPEFGRVGDEIAMHEETEVVRAVLREGGVGRYLPWAPVEHIIAADRQTVAYLRRYFYASGASRPSFRDAPTFLGRPLWVWRMALLQELLFRATRHVAPPERWARHLLLASSAWGFLDLGVGPSGPHDDGPRRGKRRRPP